jgi:actin-like ATPase involved in cell morphogenesis
MAKVVGIDLGTTNSVAAIIKSGAHVSLNRENERLTRSVVGTYRDTILVGAPAVNRGRLAPQDTIVSIKRLMGRSFTDSHVQEIIKSRRYTYEIVSPPDGTAESLRVRMGGKLYSPARISAEILKKLRNDTEYREKEAPSHAVITVPAYFSEKQRVATYQAAQFAGLSVLRLLHEPTAAAVTYGIEQLSGNNAKTVLVYDLGGGTFDVSIMVIAGTSFPEVKIKGDMWLGGDNFDELLMDYCLEQVRRELGSTNPRDNVEWMFPLREEARKAKEQLTALQSTELFLTLPNGRETCVEIARSQFEALIAPLVKRSIDISGRAIEEAGFSDADIDHVIVAGGSSSVPLVQQELERRFGADRLLRNLHPKEVVAEGAAILAARLGSAIQCPHCQHENREDASACGKCGFKLQAFIACLSCGASNSEDATTCSACGKKLGVSVAGIAQTAGPNYVLKLADGRATLIKAGDVCGVDYSRSFETAVPNQLMISAPVFALDYEDSAVDEVGPDNQSFAFLPIGLAKGRKVKLVYHVTADMIFQLRGELDDGTPVTFFKLQGGQDAAAIQVYEEADKLITGLDEQTRLANREDIDKARQTVLQFLAAGANSQPGSAEAEQCFSDARTRAEKLRELAAALRPNRGAVDRALRLASWVIGFSQEYSELLSPTTNTELVALIRRTQQLQSTRSEADAEKLSGDMFAFIDSLKGDDEFWWVIMSRIDSVSKRNPARGRYFDHLREQIIDANARGGFDGAKPLLDKLVNELMAEVKQYKERCPHTDCDAEITPGDRCCRNGHDLWLLAQGAANAAGV